MTTQVPSSSADVKTDMLSPKGQSKKRNPKQAVVDVVDASKPVSRKLRQARFNTFHPADFLDLKKVWHYKSSQQRNIQRMRNKFDILSQDPLMQQDADKINGNIKRTERNLDKLNENMHDVIGRLQLIAALSKNDKVDFDEQSSAGLSQIASQLTNSFQTPASNK